MRLILILTIFIVSGCGTTLVIPPHPALTFPAISELPKFTREMIDCRADNPETLPLCERIKEREAVLMYDLGTRDEIAREHNEALKNE